MKLFISGQGKQFKTNETKLNTTERKVKELLDRSKDGELFFAYQIANIAKVPTVEVQKCFRTLVGYSHKVGAKRYWGKLCSILQLRKETDV